MASHERTGFRVTWFVTTLTTVLMAWFTHVRSAEAKPDGFLAAIATLPVYVDCTMLVTGRALVSTISLFNAARAFKFFRVLFLLFLKLPHCLSAVFHASKVGNFTSIALIESNFREGKLFKFTEEWVAFFLKSLVLV